MSLFDDDFYSSKVTRRFFKRRPSSRFSSRKWIARLKSGSMSTLQIAFLTSLASAIFACIMFGLIFGFGQQNSSSLASVDISERAISATDKIRPAVVSIVNEQKYSTGLNGGVLDKDSEENGIFRESGVGSGVIIHKDNDYAYIVTNFHVVNAAHRVKVVLTNGEERMAEVVGLDQITDLAVLSIDAKGINTVAEIGDSSKLRAAEFVLAMGNPLGMGEATTLGIVSVISEIVGVSLNQDGVVDWEQEVIRVDAAINQGNSGGPLIDMNGRVVGINSMKIANFGVESIGYAMPINNVMPIVNQLMDQGYISRPYLGVYMMDLSQYWEQEALDELYNMQNEDSVDDNAESDLKLPKSVLSGVIVLEATGPALEAGLKYNDVIVQLDDTKIDSIRNLRKYLYNKKQIGDEMIVHYYRGEEKQSVKVVLTENKPNL